MIYTGKQIRITFKSGNAYAYRGSHFTLEIDKPRKLVLIYAAGRMLERFDMDQVQEVVEGNYGKEFIS